MCHFAKFCGERQTVAKIWPFFDFSRWRPSAILDLFYTCLRPPTKVIFIVVQNMIGIGNTILNICEFQCYASWLENAYLRPFWVF